MQSASRSCLRTFSWLGGCAARGYINANIRFIDNITPLFSQEWCSFCVVIISDFKSCSRSPLDRYLAYVS
jgi:hypothetical protein